MKGSKWIPAPRKGQETYPLETPPAPAYLYEVNQANDIYHPRWEEVTEDVFYKTHLMYRRRLINPAHKTPAQGWGQWEDLLTEIFIKVQEKSGSYDTARQVVEKIKEVLKPALSMEEINGKNT